MVADADDMILLAGCEVECDEQTRPWSAGHCDGHSNGQHADQPSQRRQSGELIPNIGPTSYRIKYIC